MVRQVVEPAQLDTAGADAYLAYRRDSGQVRRRTRRGLLPLLGYLRSVGVFDGPPDVRVVGVDAPAPAASR